MKDIIKQKVKEAKSRAVLDVVSGYFDEVGYSKPTMNDIAKVAGISVGALYKLFPSKEELFYAYISFQIEEFYHNIIRLTAKLEPKESLSLYVKMKFETFKSKRKAIEDPVLGDPLFFVKLNTKKNNPAEPIFNFLAKQFQKLVPQNKNFLKTAYLFNSYTMGHIEYWLNQGGELDDDTESIVDSFLTSAKSKEQL